MTEQNPQIVRFVALGERLPVDVGRVARRLNSLQRRWRFVYASSVTSEVLGDPDVDDHSYTVDRLLEHLRCAAPNDATLVIGVTDLRLAARPSSEKPPESDYFSLGDYRSRVSVITVHRSVAVHRGETVTLEQYLAYLVVSELLMLLAKANLSHTSPRMCLFDECADRSTLSECIERAWICEDCVAKLKHANIDRETIRDATQLLVWCKRNQWSYVAKVWITHPITNLILGTLFGTTYFSNFVARANGLIVASVLVLPLIGVGIHARFFKK